jgi:hypothetical protein
MYKRGHSTPSYEVLSCSCLRTSHAVLMPARPHANHYHVVIISNMFRSKWTKKSESIAARKVVYPGRERNARGVWARQYLLV